MNKVSLITGGAGFIGSHMVDLMISKGHEVRIIDNLECGRLENLSHHKKNINLNFYNADINNKNLKDSFFKNIDYVFHFAGIGDIVPSINFPYKYFQTNVLGTLNILDKVYKNSKVKKFVYAASSSCYGIGKTPTKENDDIQTLYPYALSKFQGEQIVLHWNKVYKLPSNSIRIFNAYGTRVKTSGAYGAVFGVFLKQKIEKKPFTLVGDGSQKRDFIYVTDVANAFYSVARRGNVGQIYNCGANNPKSIKYLIELLDGEVVKLPKRPGEPDITWADTKKIEKDTGWKPTVSFEQGVKKMLKEIDYWKDAPLWNQQSIKKATNDWFKYLK